MPFSTILYTYKDLIDHVVNYIGGVGHGATLPRVKFAIQQAYRNLVNYHPWKYLFRNLVIVLNAPYNTGTVEYDHTGGTYERQLTLTTGTWPTWAANGHIRFDDQFYEIESRKSSTVITLRENSNPGADVASGETYVLYQSRYTLPADFRKSHNAISKSYGGDLTYVEPAEWHWNERYLHQSGQVRAWTIMGDPNNPGRLALYFAPYPSTSNTIALLYQRLSRQLKYDGTGTGESTGTVTVTAGSATFTGSGTAFTSAHVGSVMRIGTASAAPDGLEGANPYAMQAIIASIASATSGTFVEAAEVSATSVKYAITDPVDIPQHMLDALFRGSEMQVATGGRNTPALSTLATVYEDAVRRALGADSTSLYEAGGNNGGVSHEISLTPYTTSIETGSGDLET